MNKAALFRALHVPGDPLVLFNIWDAGSAKAVARLGAKAVATGSWSVAAAHGLEDGEKLALDVVLANARRIAEAVDLPVTIDFESGYGRLPSGVAASVEQLAATGAVGCNIEDGLIGENRLRDTADQCERLAAAREAAGDSLFINARIDLFLRAPRSEHDRDMVKAALDRASAYAGAGADGIFVPGLLDEGLIARFCDACRRPVNILLPPAMRASVVAALGVARVSYGPGPYRLAMAALEEAARSALG